MKKIFCNSALVALIFFSACNKSSIEPTQKPELKGGVLLFDEGNGFVSKSGMTVSIENSSPVISAITDSSGNFTLPLDPSLHSFALVYTKPGFGTFKRYYMKDASNKIYYVDNNSQYQTEDASESLGNKSTVTVNSFNASIIGDALRLTFNISSPNTSGEKYIRILYQKDLPGISINTVDKTKTNWSSLLPVTNGDNSFDICLACSTICAGWKAGDKIYLTAYGDSFYSNMYQDQTTSKIILPNLNPNTNVAPVHIIVP
jgi:hypothetical protein